jgi:hypothetical protein
MSGRISRVNSPWSLTWPEFWPPLGTLAMPPAHGGGVPGAIRDCSLVTLWGDDLEIEIVSSVLVESDHGRAMLDLVVMRQHDRVCCEVLLGGFGEPGRTCV